MGFDSRSIVPGELFKHGIGKWIIARSQRKSDEFLSRLPARRLIQLKKKKHDVKKSTKTNRINMDRVIT